MEEDILGNKKIRKKRSENNFEWKKDDATTRRMKETENWNVLAIVTIALESWKKSRASEAWKINST